MVKGWPGGLRLAGADWYGAAYGVLLYECIYIVCFLFLLLTGFAFTCRIFAACLKHVSLRYGLQ